MWSARKAGVFNFLCIEKRFRKAPCSCRIGVFEERRLGTFFSLIEIFLLVSNFLTQSKGLQSGNLFPRAHVSFGQHQNWCWPTDTWALGTKLAKRHPSNFIGTQCVKIKFDVPKSSACASNKSEFDLTCWLSTFVWLRDRKIKTKMSKKHGKTSSCNLNLKPWC